MNHFKETVKEITRQWWVYVWLGVILLCGAGATYFCHVLMDAPYLDGIVIGATALVLALFFLFVSFT